MAQARAVLRSLAWSCSKKGCRLSPTFSSDESQRYLVLLSRSSPCWRRPRCECLLVDADTSNGELFLAGHASRHRPLHDVPGLVPADAQQSAGSFHGLAGLQYLDHESLHQDREPTVRLRPGDRHLNHTMLRTLHPRNAGMNERLGLAGVEVTPRPFIGMVVAAQLLLALWALPAAAFGVLDMDMNGGRLHVQSHVHDLPGIRQPKNLLVEIDGKHDSGLRG